jgi:hypothetical protein
MDVEGQIRPGDDFVKVMTAQVSATEVMLMIIGPRWIELLKRRANDAHDFVAIEIKAALEMDKRVIPVLVGGARTPSAVELPEPIKPLERCNAVELRPARFMSDCEGLIFALREQLPPFLAARANAERRARPEPSET